MKKQLPGWKVPSPDSWEKIWFTGYKKDSSLVNYASADFNGDHKKDYALILKSKNAIAVWVIQSQDNIYRTIKLEEIGYGFPIQIGIEILPKGELNYIDVDNDNPKPIKLNFPAIQIVEFERSGTTYYWKNGKYKSAVTGD